ncbi:MAG TPA: hypothetical protein VI756_25285, partial [Blastocatellia bacterium]
LLSDAYEYLGRMKDAEKTLRQSFEVPSLQENVTLDKRGWLFFLMSRGRDADAVDAAKTLAAKPWAAVRAMGHIAASHALMAMGQMPEASAEAKAAVTEYQSEPAAAPYLAPYMAGLQGEFFYRTGQAGKGRTLLETIEPKILAESGPEAWGQGLFMLDAIARFAISVSDWDLAEFTARQMDEYDPGYAGTHFALALVAEHRGSASEALKDFKLAREGWKNADPDLPEMAQVKAKIAALGGP